MTPDDAVEAKRCGVERDKAEVAGKTDQAAASVKDGLNKVKEKVEEGIDAVKDMINKK